MWKVVGGGGIVDNIWWRFGGDGWNICEKEREQMYLKKWQKIMYKTKKDNEYEKAKTYMN